MLRIHTLEKDQNYESVIYRIQQNCTIRFRTGSTLLGEKVNLFINYPQDHQLFERENFKELNWLNVKLDDYSSAFADIQLKLPGTFKYYFTLNDEKTKSSGNGNFIVEPKLLVGLNEELSLDLIQCQTVLSKCLGYFDNWKEKLQVAHNSGYNAIHFTPVQELGGSKSAYSIKDHKKLNPSFNIENSAKQYGFEDLADLIEFMRTEWKMVSITDIVLNHTANETPWLQEHPESTFNLLNSPHLRPAYLLDRLCWHILMDINSGKWETSGLPKNINCEDHLNKLRDVFKSHYLPLVNIPELYLIDVNTMVDEFEIALKDQLKGKFNLNPKETGEKLIVIQDNEYRRFKSKIDLDSAIKMALNLRNEPNEELWTIQAVDSLRLCLHELNVQIYNEIQNHLDAAVENIISATRYERLDPNGPKIKIVSCQHPLVPPYFTHIETDDIQKDKEVIYDNSKNKFIMAHNGWVMGDDPLRNFAEKGSNVYLRRELIAWGDSVKLRYGDRIEDSPFLWNYMKEYVVSTASIFHGIRLDNCHSTPIHVAKYFLDAARKERPNLFVMAELFTSSEHLDNLFVNNLGINSLIRESFSCPDSHDLGRLLHRFGADPVGAFPPYSIDQSSDQNSKFSNVKPLVPSMSHAILYDQTHDNESPFKKRTPHDLLPTAALVSMCCSATGSNRGYDELVPHHIHVVNERRLYTYWENDVELSSLKTVSYRTGIIAARVLLNNLHKDLQLNGFTEIFVDQVDFNTVAVTRFNPKKMKSVVLVARTVFFESSYSQTNIRPLFISGKINNIRFEMKMIGKPDKYKADEFVINGVQDYRAEIRENVKPEHSEFVSITQSNNLNQINFNKMEPGNVIAFEVELDESNISAMNNLEKCVQQFYTKTSNLKEIVSRLTLEDLNYILFRVAIEEADEGKGSSPYKIPNFKEFNYCGLASLMFYWTTIRTHNDLGHPICENLRQGLWLPNYIADRLLNYKSTAPLATWLKDTFRHLKNIPFYLVPKCFDMVVTPLYSLLLQHCWKCSSDFVQNGNEFVQLLFLGTVALVGFNKTSPLPPLSNQIKPPKPEVISIENVNYPTCVTIAAGLPHFSSGYMRNWGRDTFISLRGSLLVTGRFNEARYIILGFAGVLRHGLIPNLLDKGLNSRYNCRDAVWWWLQSIKDYCQIVPNGLSILKDFVNRIYPTDDSPAILDNSVNQPLFETMQESLNRHFVGIDFVERNAGKQIDEHMKPEGFNVKAGICKETGFPFGGNQFNAGTWQDKMGSSDKAGNRGTPATPRDGTAVEFVGLCYSVVNWLSKLSNDKNVYPYNSVTNQNGEKLTFTNWAEKIKLNFEKHFYISEEDLDSLVNRRQIYKDTINATERWRDFQLRPNFVVSMAVAPEIFDKEHARKALGIYEDVLVSVLGVRTLDPSDWNYNGNYNNSDDSDNYNTANGFNYHNGPEWLWPLGYYLRARKLFFNNSEDKTVKFILKKLSKHFQEIKKTDWFGLPELTNKDGSFCYDSCRIQTWSHSTILDVLYDLQVPSNE